eukprot:2378487-Pyramimonas_sp.AAC.1
MQELQRAVAVHGVRRRDDPPAFEGAQAPGQRGAGGPEGGPLPVPGGDADGLQLVTSDLSWCSGGPSVRSTWLPAGSSAGPRARPPQLLRDGLHLL